VSGLIAAASPSPTPIPHERDVVLDALTRCAAAFSRVKSFHSRVAGSFGTVLVDYRAPNLFHISSVQASTLLIGERAYAAQGGSWVPIDQREPAFLRDLVLTPRIMVRWARITVPVFVQEVNGEAGKTRIFRYMSTSGTTELYTTVWISEKDGLPRKTYFDTFDSHTTVEYGAYNEAVAMPSPPPSTQASSGPAYTLP
jgi:hypothetical protein